MSVPGKLRTKIGTAFPAPQLRKEIPMPITFTPVSYTTTRTDYSAVEAELAEAATWSALSKGIDFLSVDFGSKAEAVEFRHQAKSYAADNGLVVKEKRTPETNVTFRFNTSKDDETTEE